MIKAVIFDFDDTIADTNLHVREGLNSTFKSFYYYFPKISQEKFVNYNLEVFENLVIKKKIPSYKAEGIIWKNVFKKFKIPYSDKIINEIFNYFMNYIASHISLQPGFLDLYKYFKRREIKIAILSNGKFKIKLDRLRQLNLSENEVLLVASEIIGKEKPEPESFLYVLKKLKVQPQDSLFIGDSIHFDIEPAAKLGMKTILFMPKYIEYQKEELKNIEHKVENHKEIISIISNW